MLGEKKHVEWRERSPVGEVSVVQSARREFSSLSAFGSPPHRLEAVVVTASPYNHDWFFDMRGIGALWASMMAYDGGFEAAVRTYEGGPPPCLIANDVWFALDELERDIDAAIASLEGTQGGDVSIDASVLCPDSLMAIGANCIDFYIPAATVMGVMDGDERGPSPLATIDQSKVFLIDDFDNGKMYIEVAGSTMRIPAYVPFVGLTFVQHTFPSTPTSQIQRLQIDSPDDNTRIVTLKVANATCPAWENTVMQRFPNATGEALARLLRAGCPTIDAEFRYVRDSQGWTVSNVVRDAFPAVSIFRKASSGQLVHVSQSEPRTNFLGAIWLSGLLKLKYDVQEEKNKQFLLMQEGGCNLQ
jgi:hypothetical protein